MNSKSLMNSKSSMNNPPASKSLSTLMEDECEWVQDYDGVWEVECGGAFKFEYDGPAENSFSFCPFCGRELVIAYFSEEDDIYSAEEDDDNH